MNSSTLWKTADGKRKQKGKTKPRMLQQRKAVSGILRWCDSQDEVKVTGNTVRAAAGEHLDWVRGCSLSLYV